MNADGYADFGDGSFYPYTAIPGINNRTTMADNSLPGISVSVEGTADFTRDPRLDIHIEYNDAQSPPWPGASGYGANFGGLCLNGPCSEASLVYHQGCSAPNFFNNRINSFDCYFDRSPTDPDGRYYYCARTADSAIPEAKVWSGTTANQANLSGMACGYVGLDRTPPTATANASKTNPSVGELVTFTASATDPNLGGSAHVGSGVNASSYRWDMNNDGTVDKTGASTTYTYGAAGTFNATLTVADNVGNVATRTILMAVGSATPPPQPPPRPAASARPAASPRPAASARPACATGTARDRPARLHRRLRPRLWFSAPCRGSRARRSRRRRPP